MFLGPRFPSELAQRKRVGLITQRSQDRNLDSLITSRLAQLVERKTLNLVVVGSSPTVGILFIFYFFARSSKKIKNKNASTGTRTRILTLEGLNTTLVLWTLTGRTARCCFALVYSRHMKRTARCCFAFIAQLAEHALSKRKVTSSILVEGSPCSYGLAWL